MSRPWLAHYPDGVPAEISIEPHTSRAELLDQACLRHAGRVACTAMGTDLTYARVDTHPRAFAGWLQGPANGRATCIEKWRQHGELSGGVTSFKKKTE